MENNVMFLDVTFFPLVDDMEQSLKRSWEIIPMVALKFPTDSYSVCGQFYQVDGLPAPTIIPTPFPKGVSLLLPTERGSVRVVRSKYFCEPISFVYASELRNLKVDDPSDNSDSPNSVSSTRHKAIKAFLDALPDDTRVALWWD